MLVFHDRLEFKAPFSFLFLFSSTLNSFMFMIRGIYFKILKQRAHGSSPQRDTNHKFFDKIFVKLDSRNHRIS